MKMIKRNTFYIKKIRQIFLFFIFINITTFCTGLTDEHYEQNSIFIPIEVITPGIVYVDDGFNETTPGWGYDHFDCIQEGINAVDINGSVYTYDGVYYEHVIVNKQLFLIGLQNNENLPIIDGSLSGSPLTIDANNAVIESVIVRNAGNEADWDNSGIIIANNRRNNTILNSYIHGICYVGIFFQHTTENTLIQNNSIQDTTKGIYVFKGDKVNLSNNIIMSTYHALTIEESKNCIINSNTITSSIFGIHAEMNGINNRIIGNNISNNERTGMTIWRAIEGQIIIENNNVERNNVGIKVDDNTVPVTISNNYIYSNTADFKEDAGLIVSYNDNCIIEHNQFENNEPFGIHLLASFNCSVNENNFLGNDALFSSSYFSHFSNNYWDRKRVFPKIIFGKIGVFYLIPIIMLDWHPAQKPYEIGRIR